MADDNDDVDDGYDQKVRNLRTVFEDTEPTRFPNWYLYIIY